MAKKGTKKALIASVLSMTLSASMFVGTTFAWFTDSVESGVNTIVAGNLDVELYHADKGTNGANEKVTNATKLFDDVSSNLWEPGATAWEEFTIANEGSLALKYQFAFNVTEATVVNGVSFTTKLRATIVADGFEYTRANIEAIAEEKWSDLASFTQPGELAAGATTSFGVIIRWAPTNNDNDFNMNNGKTGGPVSVKVGAKLVATQLSAEVDGNGPDYDKDAWADGMEVISGEALQAAINNGVQNVVLADDIVLNDGPIVIPANTASVSTMSAKNTSNAFVLNLNGKTISTKEATAIRNEGDLVLVGKGKIESVTGYAIRVQQGSLVIDSDEIEVTSAFGAVSMFNDAQVTINGGTYTATGSKGKTHHCIYLYSGADLVINGGTFEHQGAGVSDSGATLTVYAGKDGGVTINGGTFIGSGTYINSLSKYDSACYLVVKGGSFSNDPSKYMAAGYKATKGEDGFYNVAFPQTSLENLFKPTTGEGGTEEKPTEINVPAGNFTFPTSALEEGMTVYCDEDTVFEGTSKLNINGATVVGATFDGDKNSAVSGTINGTFKNCVFDGYNGLSMCYAGETVVFEDCIFTGDLYGAHFDGGANKVIFRRCTFSGFNAFGAAIEKLTMEDCTFKANGRSGYNGINMWGNTEMTNCTFVFDGSAVEWIDLCSENKTAEFTNCVVTDGTNVKNFKAEVSKRHASGTVIVDGVVCVSGSTDLKAALSSEDKNVEIFLMKNISIDIGTGWKMGGIETESITIDGNGKTLTLSSTYRSYFNLANAEGKLYLNNMTLTNTHKGTHFFDYTTHFNCDVVAKEVTFAKSPLVGSGVTATFTDCVFNQEGNDIYGLWIMSGSNVTVNGGELTTDRGFKITDEDSAAESTVLNVSGTKFNNNKKAAILVTTKHGATITVANVDITNCGADKVNAVWIDEDRTAYANTIKVTGAHCIEEP